MGRLQRWYLATGLAACAIYLVLPSSDGAEVLFTLIAVSVPVVGFIALHRDQPRPKRGWFVLTSGFAVSALAEALCLTLVTWALEPQSTTVINSLFLLGYLVQLAGLLMIIQSRTTGRSRSSWLDAAAVGVATFTIIWSTLYAHLVQSSDSWLDWTTQLGEPVLGVALIAMSLRLAMGERRGFAVFGLFGAGYALQAATDLSANLLESYERGGLVDASWAVCYVLFGANLLSPGRLRPPQQAPSVLARREVQQALLLQGAVIIGVIGAIVVRATPSLQVSFVAVWVGAGAILLVLNRLRLFALFRMVSDASETENQRRLKALVDNSHEVIALADPDGVLRYVSSSVESMTGSPADEWIGTTFEEVINRYLPGIRDFVDVADGLSIGDRATWEGELIETAEGKRRTISITVVNHVDTPEVAGWVITARDVTDEARLTSELRHQALHDTLTGLPNRALLFDRIEHALKRVSRTPGEQLAVALVDLDEFKSVNDSLGHDTGDVLLQAVAVRLLGAVRPGDTVARLGGDEFALLEIASEAEAVSVAQRALECLAEPIALGDVDFIANASIGIVCHRGTADPHELLRFADIAMYEAKREGKARVKLFREHMHHAARNQLALRMSLATALDRSEFSLVYQPIVDTMHYRVRGVEALLRWTHPTQGDIPPSEFIPVAEQSGLLAPIGEWVLNKACADAATWPAAEGEPYLSVNVSAAQLSDRGFVGKVRRALSDSGFPPQRLLLELTETMLVHDDALVDEVLAQLGALGIRIAIDDFGTGYSSLAYLRQLAVDVVKIDQSFVRDLDTNSDHQALTRTMLALAEGLSMVAIAEGVETDAELAVLQRLGCEFAQGYLFSYPVTAEAIGRLLMPAEPVEQQLGPDRGAQQPIGVR